jgi:diguanylate cyclase (GGDEF)-like protein
MVFDTWKTINGVLNRFFTTRRKWKTLQYSVNALSIALVLMAAALPLRISREKSWVLEAAGVFGRGFPVTAGEIIGKIAPQDKAPGLLTPAERLFFSRVSYVLFQDGKVAAQGGESLGVGDSETLAGVPAESRAASETHFLALDGTPAWATALPLSDGRLVLYRVFPWIVGYAWIFPFVLLVLTAFALPLIVRKLQIRIQTIPNFFRRQVILYTVVAFLPAGLLCVVFGCAALAGQGMGIHWLVSAWNLLFLFLGFLALTVWSVFVAARDMNHRINDSFMVLANGMEMASNLDFDHPVIPLTQDEFGLIAEVFNQVTHLLKARINALHAIFRSLRVFSGLLDKEKVLNHSLNTFKSLEEASGIVIALWDEEKKEMVVERDSGKRPEAVGLRFSGGQGVFGRVILNPELTTFTAEEYIPMAEKCPNEAKLWGKPDFTVAIPMLLQGELKGAVALYDMKSGSFELEAKKDYLQGLANQVAIFLENARLYRQVTLDQLTGLSTHSFIEAEMESLVKQAQRNNIPLSFIMMDLDKFKQVNDHFGHAAGNQVLKAVAQAIRGVSREQDIVGRYGGDEFEILLPHTDKAGALAYTEKLRKAVMGMEIVILEGTKIRVTTSAGIASYPADVETAVQLQAAADSALYAAKALGRNCVVGYQKHGNEMWQGLAVFNTSGFTEKGFANFGGKPADRD